MLFAQKIADLSQQPLEQAVLHYTALYRIFGLDWTLDPTNPVWQAYSVGLQREPDRIDYTYRFYLQRYDSIPKFADEEHWGCFSYSHNAKDRSIHIHFADEDRSPYGALSSRRVDARKSELKAMFAAVQSRHSEAEFVSGGSWLYNWESYRRLFPPAYVQAVHEDETRYPSIWGQLPGRAIWGQFLRRNWQVHQETMDLFLQRVSQLERAEDYLQCFPYQVLRTEAPIQDFYTFYKITL
jgi:hypothetical protein